MTREDILAMPAGRELDGLVAERVMGFPNVHKFYHRYVYDNVGSLGNVMGRVDVKEYSTDISAAWEVVEKMRESEYKYKFNRHMDRGSFTSVTPLIICKAALIAVLEESP